jgi:hypothetical protein
MNAIEIKEEVLSWLKCIPEGGVPMPTQGEKGATIGLMNEAFGKGSKESNARRHQVLAWIFRDSLNKSMASSVSTHDLTPEMWYALVKYVDAHKDEDSGKWMGRDGLAQELITCWQAIMDWEKAMGQQMGFTV